MTICYVRKDRSEEGSDSGQKGRGRVGGHENRRTGGSGEHSRGDGGPVHVLGQY